MKQSLEHKIALITGGGGGIGRATAELLAKNGMRIILLGGNNLEKLDETRRIVEHYTDCTILPGDLTDLTFIGAAVDAIEKQFGVIDLLINNAGMALNCSYADVTEEQFDRIMAINIKVPFFLTQRALPLLKKSEGASVINISSVVGHQGYPFQSAYAASKHALLGFTKSFANEYYTENIRTHAICPGGVYTDMVKIARPDLTPDGMIMPEDIADIVLFLAENRGNAVVDEIVVHRVNKAPFQV